MTTPWLNYHHLLYFWTVAQEGSVTKASRKLRLAQPTISAQLKALEDSLGEKLLVREGRGVKLTEMGQLVYQYADEIFNLGRELVQTVQRRPIGRPPELRIGITDVLPKMIAYRLIEPALKAVQPLKVICQEGPVERLVAEMATHELDIVLSDAPMSPSVKIQAFNQLLGECGVTFFGVERLWKFHHRDFPNSLNGAPFLMPLRSSNFRRSLEQWFDRHNITPHITGEFDDSALMNAFGHAGTGIFAMPSIIEDQTMKQFEVKPLGRADDLVISCYAISIDRKIKHPAVAIICESAPQQVFHLPPAAVSQQQQPQQGQPAAVVGASGPG